MRNLLTEENIISWEFVHVHPCAHSLFDWLKNLGIEETDDVPKRYPHGRLELPSGNGYFLISKEFSCVDLWVKNSVKRVSSPSKWKVGYGSRNP